jgi:HlyD family secretion protein
MRRFAKPVYGVNLYRGFESRPLRSIGRTSWQGYTLTRVGLLLLGIVLGVAAAWGYQFRTPPPAEESFYNADAAANEPVRGEKASKRAIFALGTLEPRGGPVSVASSLTGYRIQKVLVQDGQSVADGDVLIELDPTIAEEELQLAIAQREQAIERQQSEIEMAQQRLATAELAVRQAQDARSLEIESQQQQTNVAELKARQARDELQRLQSQKVALTQQVEHQKTLVELAEAERDASRVALRRLEQTLDFKLQQTQAEERAAVQAVEIARRSATTAALDRQVAMARHKLEQTKIVAPSAGTVVSLAAHEGEIVGTQPLMQLANLEALVCQAEVDVADVPLLSDKREAQISSRAFRGAKIKGTIERIRNAAGQATLRPADPRKPVDRSVATIVLGVDADEARQLLGGTGNDVATALMGLQVEVEIPL